MAIGITSVGATPAQQQYRLQSAQREARQAEQVANDLRSQADAAQRSADQQQDRADGLSAKAENASERYDQARGALISVQDGSINARRLSLAPANTPFINAYGQATGNILSEVA